MRLRARWVLPIATPPIENGEVVIENGVVVEVRSAPVLSEPVADAIDYGDAALMPGLVNTHAHIEYTIMRGLLEDIAFFSWVRALTERKALLDWPDWLASATMGAAEAVAGGVTTLADCSDAGASLPGAISLGLRGIIYQEVFGIDESRSVESIIDELNGKVASLSKEAAESLFTIGVSPHSPYTVRPALFKELIRTTGESNLPVCIHAAESRAETEWLMNGSGPIGNMCARRSIAWDPPGLSSIKYLDSFMALTPHTLLVHGVHVDEDDAKLAKDRGIAWAHCPKSNAKLGNGIAPLSALQRTRVGLGSDSVASNNTMDMFEEMRFCVLAQRAASSDVSVLSAADAMEMATLGGAAALNLDNVTGSLETGKQADIIAVRTDNLHSLPCHDPISALVYSGNARDVCMTMIGGQIVYRNGDLTHINMHSLRNKFDDAARRVKEIHD